MKQSGLRFDVSGMRRKPARIGKEVKAIKFLPDVKTYTNVVLNTCVRTTPARSLSLIQTAQRRQYDNRVNYIPSVHELRDPTLIVKPNGMWLFCNGKWWNPNLWQLPPDVWSTFETLLQEHLRRMDTSKREFVTERAQARFLYKLSWVQCGQSIGLKVIAGENVLNSHTRRKPPHDPPRGYAQIRGGKSIISIVIYNPFINDDSKYRTFDGAEILDAAMQKHRHNFLAQVERRLQRILYAVSHS